VRAPRVRTDATILLVTCPPADAALADAFLSKFLEEIDRLRHLVAKVPPALLDWAPATANGDRPPFRTAELLCHVLECLAGICAVLYACDPERLTRAAGLRGLPVTGDCGVEETLSRIAEYEAVIVEGFRLLSDADLPRRLPTVFAASGELVLTLLLGNFEHLVNHKFQLYFYLKLAGQDVGSADLYVFREPAK
jgi:hypothetical protein